MNRIWFNERDLRIRGKLNNESFNGLKSICVISRPIKYIYLWYLNLNEYETYQ